METSLSAVTSIPTCPRCGVFQSGVDGDLVVIIRTIVRRVESGGMKISQLGWNINN